MSGFITNDNVYYVNTKKKTITGGILGDNICQYEHLSALIGNNAYIQLGKNNTIMTGIVTAYI